MGKDNVIEDENLLILILVASFFVLSFFSVNVCIGNFPLTHGLLIKRQRVTILSVHDISIHF